MTTFRKYDWYIYTAISVKSVPDVKFNLSSNVCIMLRGSARKWTKENLRGVFINYVENVYVDML